MNQNLKVFIDQQACSRTTQRDIFKIKGEKWVLCALWIGNIVVIIFYVKCHQFILMLISFQGSFTPHNIEHVLVVECKQNREAETRERILQSTTLYDKL